MRFHFTFLSVCAFSFLRKCDERQKPNNKTNYDKKSFFRSSLAQPEILILHMEKKERDIFSIPRVSIVTPHEYIFSVVFKKMVVGQNFTHIFDYAKKYLFTHQRMRILRQMEKV